MNTKTFFAAALTVAIAFSAGNANADADGAKLFKKKCGTCHTFDKHKVGPSLKGIVGRKAGTTDFKKYKAFKGGSDIVWDEKNLDSWITHQKKFLKAKGIKKKTGMSAKVKKEKDRKAIIAYLKGK